MKMRYALALFTMSVLGLVAVTDAAATTWLVPGNGSNTCTVPSPNCNTIAQAVTASSNGDTVQIGAGNFPVTGSIVLTKTLTIAGAGNASTFVQPNAGVTAFSVRTNNIVFQDFTIQNGGVGVAFQNASSTNTHITRIIFSGQTARGIDMQLAATFTVANVTITDCRIATPNIGMRMSSTSQVTGLTITGTTFDSNVYGIYQANDGSTSRLSNLAVSGSTFSNNTSYGMYIEELRDAVIEDSSFTGGSVGIALLKFYASNTVAMSNITIRRNQFSGFKANALDLEIYTLGLGTGMTIEDNTFVKDVGITTSGPAVFVRLPPALPNATVSILNNDVTLTGTFGAATAAYGIQLRGNGPVVLTGNTLDGGNVGGNGSPSTPPSSGVFIESKNGSTVMPATTSITGSCNSIRGFQNGVSVYDSVALAYGGLPAGAVVSFQNNTIRGNTTAGAANGASPTLDFESDWWGCPAGPGNPGCDALIGAIDAAPNAVAPPACVACVVDADCDDTLFCTGAETCNGSNQCVPASDPCTGGPVCGNVCNEASDDCVVANGTPCRASAGPCDVAESCDGVGTACPADAFEPVTTLCRAAAGECDVDDFCPGSGAACTADAKQANGSSCTSDGNPCSLDQCDGTTDGCQHPAGNAGAPCRAVGGVCDVAETCDGAGTVCPADAFAPATTLCRAAAGECDTDDFCTGGSAPCVADAKQSSGTACTADANPCSLDQCDGASDTCQHPAGNAGAPCRGVGGVCDVAEACDGASITCPADAFEPASTVCRAASGVCDAAETCTGSDAECPVDASLPDGTVCSDGVSCTLDDACAAGVCVGDSMTCGDGITQGGCSELCDDGNQVSGDGCSSTCQPEFVCTPTPLIGCRTSPTGKSQLALKNKSPDTKDQSQWRWGRGSITAKSDFGTPTVAATTDYQFCIYANGVLVSRAFIPAGGTCGTKPCWKESPRGFQYKDKDATPDGVTALKLKEGLVAGKAQIQLKGKGDHLDMPVLPLAQPVLVQIRNSDGVCWETTHGAPASKNDGAQFKDKND